MKKELTKSRRKCPPHTSRQRGGGKKKIDGGARRKKKGINIDTATEAQKATLRDSQRDECLTWFWGAQVRARLCPRECAVVQVSKEREADDWSTDISNRLEAEKRTDPRQHERGRWRRQECWDRHLQPSATALRCSASQPSQSGTRVWRAVRLARAASLSILIFSCSLSKQPQNKKSELVLPHQVRCSIIPSFNALRSPHGPCFSCVAHLS